MTDIRTARSNIPITALERRQVQRVLDDLIAIRPANWDDARDPAQCTAWQAAERLQARLKNADGR